MPAWLQSLDIALFRFINGTLKCPPLDVLLPLFDSNAFFVPVVFLLFGLLCWRGGTRGRLFVVVLLIAISLGEVFLVGPLKDAIGRPRPYLALEGIHLLGGRGRSGSMPSAHTSIWFAAVFIAHGYYPRSWRLLLLLALTMGFSRVYVGAHFPADVLAGALIGAGYAAAVLWALHTAWRSFGPAWFPLWWRRVPAVIVRDDRPPPVLPAPDPATETAWREGQYLRLGYVILAVLMVIRLAYVGGNRIELSEDEAYQWLWSKNLALSYFSKPPLIAYAQWLGTHLLGDTELGVRFLPPVLGAVLGLMVLRFMRRVASARVGLFVMLALNVAPLMQVGSLLMTVDPLLVLFWTAALVAGWLAVQADGATSHWLWAGLWMGLGFLSKYTALAQLACWAIFFILHSPARAHLRRPGPWLALLIVAACTLPVLVWNAQHGWAALGHLSTNAKLEKAWQPTLKYFADFAMSEAALLNPILFVAALWSAFAFWRREPRDPLLVYLFAMGTPLFLGYWLFTLHSRVQPNWIAAAVVPMFCHMAVYWDRRWRAGVPAVKRWLAAALILGFATAPFLHETDFIRKVTGIRLPAKMDPLRRVRGIEGIARVVARERNKLLTEGREVFILTAHYGPAGQLSFYLPEARQGLPKSPLVYCRLGDTPKSQFFFWPHYRYREHRRGQNAIFVQFDDGSRSAPEGLRREFESVTDLGIFEVKRDKRVFHQVHVFACRGLR